MMKSTARNHGWPSRRGVVLLVALGMLALFMLIAVSFVMMTSSARRGAVAASRVEQSGDTPDGLLNMAKCLVAWLRLSHFAPVTEATDSHVPFVVRTTVAALA